MSLELNELNFHYVRAFCEKGLLPNFTKLLSERDLIETDAGEVYPQLEPWIQWPTVYTGKPYTEHGIFRLGDIVYKDQPQIWDYLEQNGVSVGAISPMNASNRCKDPSFFLPDPWTQAKIVADPRSEKLFRLLCRIVNENASSDGSISGFARQILPLALPYLSSRTIVGYFKILPMALRYKWAKAAFLDRLLADLFVTLWHKHRPGFASLFLNAGAHIQHHHTYDSAAYGGQKSNPTWYSKAAQTSVDPLLFIYQVYDDMVGEFMVMNDVHLFITTGLSQIPNERDHYQYRIIDFEGFLAKVGLDGAIIRPRMSRDFMLEFATADAAKAAIPVLNRVLVAGRPLFTIEERGDTLFCQVGYFGKPEGLEEVSIAGVSEDLSHSFVLVSIENAIHQATGYHIDTLAPKKGAQRIPLVEVFDRLCAAALVSENQTLRAA